MKKIVISLLLLLICAGAGYTQTSEYINGREFIFHTVKRGETVYGISRKYKVPQDSIFAYNENAKNGIKVDQILKVPTNNYQHTSNNIGQFIEHVVKHGETLYGIAKKYGVTVADLEKYNPQVKDGLKAEDVIRIPVKNNNENVDNLDDGEQKDSSDVAAPIDSIPQTVNCDSIINDKKEFKIALILPFKGNSFSSTKIASEFYYGFKVAIDSVVAVTKKKIKLYVINSSATSDSDKVEEKYDFNKLKQMDMIVGPLYASNIGPIAEFAKENKIPIVSPFTINEGITEKNPYAIKITPSDKLLAMTTITYFKDSFPDCNFVLVDVGSRRDSMLHAGYKQAFEELNFLDSNRVHFVRFGKQSVSSGMVPGVKNVIIYMSSREITVKDFITKFNKAHKKSDISMIGTEGWLEFNNVEADYYTNLNLHIPVPTYPDFSDSTDYYHFIRQYQKLVKADPSVYSFKGYKIGADLVGRFMNYGPYLCNCIDKLNEAPILEDEDEAQIPFRFNFIRKSEDDGWENSSIQILSVYDYYLFITNHNYTYPTEK